MKKQLVRSFLVTIFFAAIPCAHTVFANEETLSDTDLSYKGYSIYVKPVSQKEWKAIPVYWALVSDFAKKKAHWQDYTGATRDTMAFALFSDPFTEPIEVRVVKHDRKFKKAHVRPLSYNIPVHKKREEIRFTLTSPQEKISIEFDEDRQHNLFLFPDLPDENRPDPENIPAGMRYFGAGEHVIPGGILYLKPHETLYLDEGAIVYGVVHTAPEEGSSHAQIRGRGILSGSKNSHEKEKRTQLISVEGADHLLVEGVLLHDSPHWTLRLYYSDYAHIKNVKQIGWIMNSDGVDVCNSSHVLIEDCFFRNFDDNISIKNFYWGECAMSDITVRNCVFWADAAHCMLVGPEGGSGSSTSDILFENIIVLENRETYFVYTGVFGVMASDQGTFRNITFRNIEIEEIRGGRLFSLQFCPYEYTESKITDYPPYYGKVLQNVRLENIRFTKSRKFLPAAIRGYNAERFVDGVVLKEVYYDGEKLNLDHPLLEIGEHVKNLSIE